VDTPSTGSAIFGVACGDASHNKHPGVHTTYEDGAITSAIYTDSRSEGEHDFRSSEASLSFKVALLFDLPTGSSTQPWPGFGRLWR
jgi:hypothetical protein